LKADASRRVAWTGGLRLRPMAGCLAAGRKRRIKKGLKRVVGLGISVTPRDVA